MTCPEDFSSVLHAGKRMRSTRGRTIEIPAVEKVGTGVSLGEGILRIDLQWRRQSEGSESEFDSDHGDYLIESEERSPAKGGLERSSGACAFSGRGERGAREDGGIGCRAGSVRGAVVEQGAAINSGKLESAQGELQQQQECASGSGRAPRSTRPCSAPALKVEQV